jgi:hypothetical protein
MVRTVVEPILGLLQGPSVLNPQTGLYEERITVTNTGSSTLAAFQVLWAYQVAGRHAADERCPRQCHRHNVDGRSYALYNAPVDPGQLASMILEFRVGDRRPLIRSRSSALPPGPDVIRDPPGIDSGVVLTAPFMDFRSGEPRLV